MAAVGSCGVASVRAAALALPSASMRYSELFDVNPCFFTAFSFQSPVSCASDVELPQRLQCSPQIMDELWMVSFDFLLISIQFPYFPMRIQYFCLFFIILYGPCKFAFFPRFWFGSGSDLDIEERQKQPKSESFLAVRPPATIAAPACT